MAALGRPQPYRLQTSRPQVGLGPLVHKDGGRKAESQHFISLFFALQFWQVYPPTLSAHCFCTFFAFVFFALFSLVFRFFSHFFCISLETSSNFSFPDAAWTGSQGLPVPPLSPPPPLASRVPAPP